jgi:hypothetical protein
VNLALQATTAEKLQAHIIKFKIAKLQGRFQHSRRTKDKVHNRLDGLINFTFLETKWVLLIPKHNLFTNMVRKDFRITKTTTTVHAETI